VERVKLSKMDNLVITWWTANT